MNDRGYQPYAVSQETLRRVEQDDSVLTKLFIGILGSGASVPYPFEGGFVSRESNEYSKLGASIGENTHLTRLLVFTHGIALNSFPSRAFARGLKRNSSIRDLELYCNDTDIVDVMAIRDILNAYQENNNLTQLTFIHARLQTGGVSLIVNTLRRCTNLKQLKLPNCDISNEQLLPIIEAVRQHSSLEELNLRVNRIGNAGCEAFATLLDDLDCNLHTIHLGINGIGNEGATSLANALVRNNSLRKLNLLQDFGSSVQNVFSRVLCNTTSISDIYSSNHTLEELKLSPQSLGKQLASLLRLNKGRNKSHVAVRKILKYHPNIDMEPFFEWNMEGEGERNLKALPYVIAWFERAVEAIAEDEEEESYNIERRRLDSINQFATSMPLLFVPVSHIKNQMREQERKEG